MRAPVLLLCLRAALSSPPPPSPSPPPNPGVICDNTCYGEDSNGWCQDGGGGSATGICTFGTDCADCGARYYVLPHPQDLEPSSTAAPPEHLCLHPVCPTAAAVAAWIATIPASAANTAAQPAGSASPVLKHLFSSLRFEWCLQRRWCGLNCDGALLVRHRLRVVRCTLRTAANAAVDPRQRL